MNGFDCKSVHFTRKDSENSEIIYMYVAFVDCFGTLIFFFFLFWTRLIIVHVISDVRQTVITNKPKAN